MEWQHCSRNLLLVVEPERPEPILVRGKGGGFLSEVGVPIPVMIFLADLVGEVGSDPRLEGRELSFVPSCAVLDALIG